MVSEHSYRVVVTGEDRHGAGQYFLGPFVYYEQSGDIRSLVDGQQRFTTLHLIFMWVSGLLRPVRGFWLGSRLQVVLGGGLEGVEAGPGEAADEALVDVGEAGVGQVVAQVVEVGPGLVGADGLAGCLGVGQGLVPGGDPEPVQNPPVAVVVGEPVSVALAAQGGNLGQ